MTEPAPATAEIRTKALEILADRLSRAGLGSQVESWLGDGSNREVTGEQVMKAVGAEKVAAFAARSGITPEEWADQLAQQLPQVVDRASEHGEITSVPVTDL